MKLTVTLSKVTGMIVTPKSGRLSGPNLHNSYAPDFVSSDEPVNVESVREIDFI